VGFRLAAEPLAAWPLALHLPDSAFYDEAGLMLSAPICSRKPGFIRRVGPLVDVMSAGAFFPFAKQFERRSRFAMEESEGVH